MGYRLINARKVRSIIRRYVDGQSLSEISLLEGFERKTIRRYIKAVEEHGVQAGGAMPSEEVLVEISSTTLPIEVERGSQIQIDYSH